MTSRLRGTIPSTGRTGCPFGEFCLHVSFYLFWIKTIVFVVSIVYLFWLRNHQSSIVKSRLVFTKSIVCGRKGKSGPNIATLTLHRNTLLLFPFLVRNQCNWQMTPSVMEDERQKMSKMFSILDSFEMIGFSLLILVSRLDNLNFGTSLVWLTKSNPWQSCKNKYGLCMNWVRCTGMDYTVH